jgi:hypothetical protein
LNNEGRTIIGLSDPKSLCKECFRLCHFAAELYEYAVEAKDPERGAVVFELETGPAGMVIDKASGRVVWKVPPSLKGTHHAKIVAADAQGARSWQEFDLSIPASQGREATPTS